MCQEKGNNKENIYISGFCGRDHGCKSSWACITSSLRSATCRHSVVQKLPNLPLPSPTIGKGVKVYISGFCVHRFARRRWACIISLRSVEDEAGFVSGGLERLCEICKLLDCRYIRMFSFFIPHGKDPDSYRDVVIEKLRKFAAVAEKHDVILLHENEKDIYGDTGALQGHF